MKRLFAALLVTLLLAFTPATSVDCTEGCAPSPLQVQSSSVQAKTLSVAILNNTNDWVFAYITGVVQSGGEEIYFYGSINAGPNGISLFQTTFQRPIQVVSCLTVCSLPPDAPNEGPDPITVTFEEEPGVGEAPKKP